MKIEGYVMKKLLLFSALLCGFNVVASAMEVPNHIDKKPRCEDTVEDASCPICMDQLCQSDDCFSTTCEPIKHKFHAKCILPVIAAEYQRGKDSFPCPLCRNKQPITNGNPLYNRAILSAECTEALKNCVKEGKSLSIIPLVTAGANPTDVSRAGLTLLHIAVLNNYPDVLNALFSLEQCRDKRFIEATTSQDIDLGNYGIFSAGYTALRIACRLGFLSCVKNLVEHDKLLS